MKWFALFVLAGCASGTGEIISDTRDLSEGDSPPRVDAVVELGGGDVIVTAPLRGTPSDGVVVVGEALWVRGANFGRQPTVTLGGRPMAVLARSSDGGLVARVPPGVPAGSQPLTVTNHKGRGDLSLNLRRMVVALPPRGEQLLLADLGPEGARPAGEVGTTGQQLVVGADGRAAYVLDAVAGRLQVIELPAPDGPRAVALVDVRASSDPVVRFAAATAAPVLMIARARSLSLLDLTAPLRPVRRPTRALPAALQAGVPVAAALSPDGRLAAVALQGGNRLVLLDLDGAGSPRVLGELALAPDARVPVVADVAFVADGRTVWVALGDTAQSRAIGPQPTELVAVRLGPGGGGPGADAADVLTIARRVTVAEARAPVRLNTGRAPPLPSGASIRLPPERAAVYLTASNRAGVVTVFRLGADDRAVAFVAPGGPAGAADLSPDGRWLLVPVAPPGGPGGAGLGLLTVPADDRPGQRQLTELGGASGRATAPVASTAAGEPPLPGLATQP